MTRKAEILRLRGVLSYLGFNSYGKCNARIIWYVASGTILTANATFYIVHEWFDADKRITGIKTMIYYLILGFHALVFVFNWDNLMKAFTTIEANYYVYPFSDTKDHLKTKDKMDRYMVVVSLFWYYSVIICVVIGTIPPLLMALVAIAKEPEVNVETLLLLFPIYYPKNHKSWLTYFTGYSAESIFLAISAGYGYFAVTTTVTSMLKIESELKLLRHSVEQIDYIVHHHGNVNRSESSTEIRNLKMVLRYLVQHHQFIHRKVSDVKSGIQCFAFIINSGVSLYICMGLLYVVKSDDTMKNMQEVFNCCLYAVDILGQDLFGERIATEDENLKRALYGCSWYGKPRWFQKSLQIMLTRMNRPIEIKPFGLFVLNLRNFSTCANAAYSYYNVLNNLK